jgi:shikimate dehydrogenase
LAAPNHLQNILNCLSNRLATNAIGSGWIAGVIGSAPSQYSKSPALWNAAFGYLGMEAKYLPFDVEGARLDDLLAAVKQCERVLGINVTVPHKLDVIQHLDEVDSTARRIGAVNTIVRLSEGRLTGHNTDGAGFIASVIEPQAAAAQSLLTSLAGLTVLLLGAGGSARAVAFHVADRLQDGRLVICNRTLKNGQELAEEICRLGVDARAISETELSQWAPQAGLIVNCTTKGQGGLRKNDDGIVLSMEAYSALAPANPVAGSESEYGIANSSPVDAKRASDDIAANHRISLALAQMIPQSTPFYDLIYHPAETPFLRHGRLTGHRTMNGRSMIVCQAVLAFARHICAQQLIALGKNNSQTFRQIAEVMYRAW